MSVRIYKKLSKSTGTRRLESEFWFEKSSYEEYIAICDFSEVFSQESVITSVDGAALNNLDANVTSDIIESAEIIVKDRSVNIILQKGSVAFSPYTIIVRAITDLSEQSELQFEMRISYDSTDISEEKVTFGGDDVTFGGDPDVSFGGN